MRVQLAILLLVKELGGVAFSINMGGYSTALDKLLHHLNLSL